MPTFIGYNSIGAVKKVTLTDKELIVRDILNAFNIKQGQVTGRPELGCPIWRYLFDQVTQSSLNDMIDLVAKTVRIDPRVQLVDPEPIKAFQQDNGILFEIQVRIATDLTPTQLNIFFDSQAQQASLSL